MSYLSTPEECTAHKCKEKAAPTCGTCKTMQNMKAYAATTGLSMSPIL